MTSDAPPGEGPPGPVLPPSPLDLGLNAMHEGRTADALHCFEQAYHLNPSDYRLHQATGELYFSQGETRRAREYLQYAIFLAPQAPDPRYRLALVALQEGRSAEALQLLGGVVALQPDHEEARRALEAEQQRSSVARRLPIWQPRREYSEEILLRPPRQIGPDGRDRPAPLRAPHHCVNCYFRAGQTPERMFAYRYRWWNLGLVGMLFGGWPVYLIWTLASREQRFSFEPLFCPVCSSHRRLLSIVFWVAMSFGWALALATLIAFVAWAAQPSEGLLVFLLATVVLTVACGLFAGWAVYASGTQRGVRLRSVGDEEVAFAFCGSEYLSAFRALNGSFTVDRVKSDSRAEATSFLPAAEEEPTPPRGETCVEAKDEAHASEADCGSGLPGLPQEPR